MSWGAMLNLIRDRAREMMPAVPADLPRLPVRPTTAHKGTQGTVGIIGGSCGELLDAHGGRGPTMIGAPALAARAALRSGCGLVKVGSPVPILSAVISLCPGATGMGIVTDGDGWYEPHVATAAVDRVLGASSVLAIGPGLGTSPGACAAVLRAMNQDRQAVVLDADALNCLEKIPEFVKDFHAPAILTPHPGEFVRIVRALGMSGDLGLSNSREKACGNLAQRLGRVVVLKGKGTVVSDGQRTWTNPSGHSCLATAGTGDVLTGLIAGLAAQYVGLSVGGNVRLPDGTERSMPRDPFKPLDLFDAARVGVWAHGAGGELWAGLSGCSGGLLAEELADVLPLVLESMRT